MDPNVINAISTLGFPIVACIALFVGCKYMLDNQQRNTDKMFEMYDKANTENREAIKACTEAINKLCDKLERLPNEK
jgi:hypothetical protein